jgi:hypothetical protein
MVLKLHNRFLGIFSLEIAWIMTDNKAGGTLTNIKYNLKF